MLKNNLLNDWKYLLSENDTTQVEIAEKTGTTTQYVSRLVRKKSIINQMYLKLINRLGYDVKIQYIRKEMDFSE
jgi:transcriptional regulator with XRE-family HTH domain